MMNESFYYSFIIHQVNNESAFIKCISHMSVILPSHDIDVKFNTDYKYFVRFKLHNENGLSINIGNTCKINSIKKNLPVIINLFNTGLDFSTRVR